MIGIIIETSTSLGSLLLIKEGQILDKVTCDAAHGLSTVLMPELHQMLNKNFIHLKQLSYIAVGIGPGSYTGTRIGATIAQTLSYALKIPLIGFDSFLAFMPDCEGKFYFLMDAKMNQQCLFEGFKEKASIAFSPFRLIEPENWTPAEVDHIILQDCSLKAFPDKQLQAHLNPTLLVQIIEKKFYMGAFTPASQLKLHYFR